MILSDVEINRALSARLITIEPFRSANVKGASYDFGLSPYFRVFDGQGALAIDPLQDQGDLWKPHVVDEGDRFILRPGTFALASSVECFRFDHVMAGRLEGKSSVARFGLIIHAAGFFDPGFVGHATLELFNPTSLPIILYPGMVIGQMSFMRMDGRVARPYGGRGSKYQYQSSDPQPSRYFLNYPDGVVPYPEVSK